MAHSEQGIVKNKQAEEQPKNKQRAKAVHASHRSGQVGITRSDAPPQSGRFEQDNRPAQERVEVQSRFALVGI